jgi:hypothetical protein
MGEGREKHGILREIVLPIVCSRVQRRKRCGELKARLCRKELSRSRKFLVAFVNSSVQVPGVWREKQLPVGLPEGLDDFAGISQWLLDRAALRFRPAACV